MAHFKAKDAIAPNNSPNSSSPTTSPKEPPAKVNLIGFLFPIMALIGTPLMLITSLCGVKTENNALKYVPNQLAKILHLSSANQGMLTSYKAGKGILAMGIIPKTIIGVMYGLQAQQPSILLAHLLQLPLTKFIWQENKIATTVVYLMGGLFTLGFINDVENGHLKDGLKDANVEKPRLYNMARIKQVFARQSGLSFMSRISQFFSESAKMLRFSAQDHILTTQRALSEVKKLVHGDKSELTDLKTTGSISKSSLGFLLCYAATLPALVSAMAFNGKGVIASVISKYSMVTTLLSGIMLNFGMILVALNGKNWAERVPLVGTTMELSGTVAGYSTNNKIQPIAMALQQLGGGLNTIFFAHQAQRKDSPAKSSAPTG